MEYLNKSKEELAQELAEVQRQLEALKASENDYKQARQVLWESQAQFAGILDIANEAIISIDEEQRIILFNKGAERIFGYAADEVIGQSLDILMSQKAATLHRSHVHEFAKSPVLTRLMGERQEIFGRRKGGEEFPAEASISKLEVDDKKIFTAVLRDVTDRKQAERQLRRQNRDLAALNDISQVVSSSLDLDTVLSRALEQVLAVTETEVGEIFLLDEAGQNLVFKLHRGLFPEEFQEITRFPIGEGFPGLVAASGQALVVTDLATDPRFTRRAVVAQGFQAMASVPLRAQDRVVGVMNVADRRKIYTNTDLNLLSAIGNQLGVFIESARLHAQVQHQVNYLNTLIENCGNAIIATDLKGRILSWNRGAEEIYGWSKEEVIGQTMPMVPPHLREESGRLMGQIIQFGETLYNFETQRLRKGGELIPVMVTVSPIKDIDGKLVSLLGISTDMRDKKRLEQELLRQQRALAVLEERERLARELHDNLGQILGYVNTQTQAAREMLSKDQVTVADAYLKRLVEVVQDAHADVREDILSLQANPLKEEGLLPALETYLQQFSRRHGIKTELTASDELADIVFGSNVEIHLMRIIQEAVTNIRKHAGAQHVRISFEIANDQAQITIEDDGCGFDPDQTSSNDERHFGLRIMQDRAKEIGGNIRVQSNPGQGTTVKIQTPLGQEG